MNQVLWPKFLEWLPPGTYDAKKNSLGVVVRLDVKNGSRIHFMSANQDDISFEAATLDWAAFDEPLRRSIYDSTRRGLLRASGSLWWSFTPLTEEWIFNELWEPAIKGDRLDIGAFIMSTWDNCEDNGGFLPKEAITNWEEDLTVNERDARIYGQYKCLTGRIYTQFDEEKHVLPSDFEIPALWPIWEGVDPHPAKPHAWIQVAISPDGELIIMDEIFQQIGISDLAEKIAEKRKIESGDLFTQRRVLGCMLDTPGKIRGWDGESSPLQLLAAKGIRTTIPSKVNNKDNWIQTIQYLLDIGKIKVKANCTRTRKEFSMYRKNKFGEIVKEYDDMMDLLGYIVMQSPKFKSRPKAVRYA